MLRNLSVFGLGLFCLAVFVGCQEPQFGGVYVVERHKPELKIAYVAGNVAQGELKVNGTEQGQLLPIDLSTFPRPLKDLIQPWNDQINDFNAELNEFFPNEILISHPPLDVETIQDKPGYILVKISNPAEPDKKYFMGGCTARRFVAFALGKPQGDLPRMGGLIGGSAVYGVWDGSKTVEGFWFVATTLVSKEAMVILGIKVPYTATMIISE